MCFFECDCDHRDLHVLTHSFPTRRSSDLATAVNPPIQGLRPPPWSAMAPSTGARTASATPERLSIRPHWRSEEHTSELQSLMRNSYAVFCLKKHTNNKKTYHLTNSIHMLNDTTRHKQESINRHYNN